MSTKLSARTIGTLLGKSRWQTPWQCFCEKVTGIRSFSTNAAMNHGLKYEKTALDIYSIHTGNEYSMVGKSIAHPSYDFITGKIDGFVESKDILLEVKCPYNKKMPDEFVVDDFYWIQVQIYMEILNINETHFIEYYRTNDVSSMRYKSIFRDKKWFEEIFPNIDKYYNEINLYKEIGIKNHPVYKVVDDWEDSMISVGSSKG